MPVLRTKTSRMWLPDALRGLALLNMLAYHAMYDWVYVFGHESSWYNIWAPGCHVWQQYICWSFILLSGFSFPLAKRPAKNGLIVAGCAANWMGEGWWHLPMAAKLRSSPAMRTLGRAPSSTWAA